MAATMSFGALYPGRPTTQEKTNPDKTGSPAPSAMTPGGKTNADWNVPVLTSVANGVGLSLPVLIALGGIAWFLFRQYD